MPYLRYNHHVIIIKLFLILFFNRSVPGLQQKRKEIQRFLTYLLSPHRHRLCHYQHYSSEWYYTFFFIKDESTLTHHNPKSIVFISLALGVVYSVGLDRCIMTYIHHLSIIQITFTALKILCTLPLFLIIYCF